MIRESLKRLIESESTRDAELSVIGAVLLRADAFEDAGLIPEQFFDKNCAVIWEALGKLRERNEPIDIVTVEAELERTGRLNCIPGGITFLNEPMNAVPTADNVAYYAAIIKRNALTRETHMAVDSVLGRPLEGEDLISEIMSVVGRLGGGTDSDLMFAGDRVKGEADERRQLASRILPFGVQFLDDALGGILPHDMVLIGAPSGAGKTALASGIAEVATSPERAKRVVYIALEAEPREIERRIKYRLVSRYIGEVGMVTVSRQMNYRDWYMGKLDAAVAMTRPDLSEKIEQFIGEYYRTLRTYYRGRDFDVATLERLFRLVSRDSDLIILDHLHYVDTDDDENENRAHKRIVKRIRDISIASGVPVIVVAHLRKKDRRVAQVIPTIDDFHGSSDITKIATRVIVLAPCYDQKAARPYLWRTYMRVEKDRLDGPKPYVALLTFNARDGRYEPGYELGRLSQMGDKWEAIGQDEYPRWAKIAIREPGEEG